MPLFELIGLFLLSKTAWNWNEHLWKSWRASWTCELNRLAAWAVLCFCLWLGQRLRLNWNNPTPSLMQLLHSFSVWCILLVSLGFPTWHLAPCFFFLKLSALSASLEIQCLVFCSISTLKVKHETVTKLLSFRKIVHLNISDMLICSLQKRYSLAVGPPKKVPKVKGVESAAVQAFLRRKEEEKRKKGNCWSSPKYILWKTFIDSLRLWPYSGLLQIGFYICFWNSCV